MGFSIRRRSFIPKGVSGVPALGLLSGVLTILGTKGKKSGASLRKSGIKRPVPDRETGD